MEPLKKGLVLDGIAATEDRDSQGEILRLNGADISEMTTKGVFNADHRPGFENMLGRIVEAKKIFKEGDCENDRQKNFWKNVKRPFLYVKGELFDDEKHPGAVALASIAKHYQQRGIPTAVKFSVEGKVVARDNTQRHILKESRIRNVAVTITPANDCTTSGIIDAVKKSVTDEVRSRGEQYVAAADSIFKSMDAPAKRLVDVDPLDELGAKFAKLNNLRKELSAGYGSADAPAARTGGAAIMTESVHRGKRIKRSDLRRLSDTNRQEIIKRLVSKAKMKHPDVDDSELQRLITKVLSGR